MRHKLVLDLPDPIYEPLAKVAKENGITPEQVAVQWLEAAGSGSNHDPVENFIGALRSNIPDWADQHDKYLGQALTDRDHGANKSEG
jgi:aryl-alcohol dehydrogenase-like predicted oxidoreductase